MLSVIIPAHREQDYLNRTIENIYATVTGDVEVIVVDQGGNGSDIDSRAVVLHPGRNVGERVAMNLAAASAKGSHLFRIDAHCDFSPVGWDQLLCDATGPSDLTMAVLTAIRMPWDLAPDDETDKWKNAGRTRADWHDWERLPGHWYGFTRFVVSQSTYGDGLEAKWQKANRDHADHTGTMPTMAATGCAMCLQADFYRQMDGADEDLPPMGAIGEEFALSAWRHGGRCQVLTDVMVGHVFGTGGYGTDGVDKARHMLHQKYFDVYESIIDRPEFASWNRLKIVRADQPGRPVRNVDVIRTDTTDSRGPDGRLQRRKIATFRYLWISTEHPGEEGMSDKEIEERYAPQGVQIKEEIIYADPDGNLLTEGTR